MPLIGHKEGVNPPREFDPGVRADTWDKPEKQVKKLLIVASIACISAGAATAKQTTTATKGDTTVAQDQKVYVSKKDSKRRKVIKRRGFWSLGGFR